MAAPADANAAITGELVAAEGITTISGAKVGVTGTVEIDDGTTVTISGSEKAVGSLITYNDGTLYGSADENGAAGDTVEFKMEPTMSATTLRDGYRQERNTGHHSGEAGTAGKSYCGLPRQVFFQALLGRYV